MKQMVAAELRERGIEPFDFQVVSVEEIERSVPFLKQSGFGALRLEKMADSANPLHSCSFWELDAYLSHIGRTATNQQDPSIWVESQRKFLNYFEDLFPELRGHAIASMFESGEDGGAAE